ncbi:MAG: cation:proton antiporter [Rikenellaceae bacterium]
MIQTLMMAEHFVRPIENPVVKFLIILAIILFAPLVLNRLRIPHILGLIIAGAIVGPYGFNLILRDDGILLSGTAGMLYLMFLAGLEIDFNELMRNRLRSIVFGLFTFLIPLGMGLLTGLYILNFSLITSLMLGSMFASHTLVTYPMVAKMGVKRNRAVTVAIGGTVITDTLALLSLSAVVGLAHGEVDKAFWIELFVSVIIFAVIVIVLFPIIARFFLKRVSDGMSQFIFVLFMVFLGAVLAEVAGLEAIIGAFFAGLSLNRLIPQSSALMNRIDFVGNAIFIPFFLISVGMLIDFRVFISDWNTIITALVMTTVALLSKYLAAYFAQKSFRFTSHERNLIYGLSSARVAATLAMALVGYNLIVAIAPDGSQIRLLSDSVLNGTILMIFITCTVASFSAQRAAHKISMSEEIDLDQEDDQEHRLLIPIYNEDVTDEIISFAHLLTPKSENNLVSVAAIIDSEGDQQPQLKRSQKLFEQAMQCSAAAERVVDTCLRYDTSYTNGILNLMREYNVSDLLLDIDSDKFVKESLLNKISHNEIHNGNVTTFAYRSCQPVQTIKRHVIIIPPNAELEFGFRSWIIRVWNLLRSTGASALIYANKATLEVIAGINKGVPVPIETCEFESYKDLLIVTKELKSDDGVIFIMSKRLNPSYHESMESIPRYINTYFNDVNVVLVYPYQHGVSSGVVHDASNPEAVGAVSMIEDLVEGVIGKIIRRS